MAVNARTEKFQHLEVFDKPALFTNGRIARDTVPKGWYCYDIRGSDDDPGELCYMEENVVVNHAGSVLMPEKLVMPKSGRLDVRDELGFLDEGDMTLREFCETHQLPYPTENMKFHIRPARPDEAGLFYTPHPEEDKRRGKQRKPVAIKNLAELKRFIQPGIEFKTLSQKNHPDLVGLTRVVTTVQTVCFYSKIKDQPNSRFSTDNGGKGFRTDFAKADAYIFDGTTVKVKDTRNKDRGVIYEFEFYDREQTMQEDTNMDRKMVNFIKEQYPPGTRIRLNSMEDPYAPIVPGTEGKVDFVDDIGTIHMKWDNGRALGIVPGEDSFSVLPPKLTTLKLYMPLTADFYERSEYGDLEPESTELDGHALRGYQNQIMAELVKNRMPEETERGLMHWYHEADSVNTKVHSVVFTAEERDRKLWGVAECRIDGELNAAEMDTLKAYIAGQASDGWGEHFEQQEILVDGGSELYVHLWNADDWGIQTEQERFTPKLAEGLPELCFSVLPSTGELICIKRGENGYYPSDWSTDDPAQNRELADYNNERLGVTQAQRLAMECGSMHGWDIPGADPSSYQQTEPQMGGMNLG